jgi:tRNA (adenine57-N1/adenine58-N1)-methyltransferase
VIEAGSGSGALTLAMARAVAPHGRVYSYESRPEMQRNALRNLQRVGLSDYVEFKMRDIADGFDETGVDALFLDVRTPWDYLGQAYRALKGGGFFGSLVPTTNQVSDSVAGLEANHFGDIEVEELLLRAYKPVPERLRPADTMVGHTGYLIFARKIEEETGEEQGTGP